MAIDELMACSPVPLVIRYHHSSVLDDDDIIRSAEFVAVAIRRHLDTLGKVSEGINKIRATSARLFSMSPKYFRINCLVFLSKDLPSQVLLILVTLNCELPKYRDR